MQLEPEEQYADKQRHAAFNDGSTIHGWTNVQPRREGLSAWGLEKRARGGVRDPALGCGIKTEQTRGDRI